MFVDGYAVDKLKIIAHAHCYCPGTAEQPVIETFSASKAVPATVICNAGHHNQIYVGDIDRIVAVGFLYVERAQMCARSLVGQDVEVRSMERMVEKMRRAAWRRSLSSSTALLALMRWRRICLFIVSGCCLCPEACAHRRVGFFPQLRLPQGRCCSQPRSSHPYQRHRVLSEL